MADYDFNSIFEQINNLKKPTTPNRRSTSQKRRMNYVKCLTVYRMR